MACHTPAARPISIRIGNLTGAASFWAAPTFTGCSLAETAPLRKVLSMERFLAHVYHSELDHPLDGKGQIPSKDLQPGLWVCARLKPRAKFWYRAQVHSLIRSPHGLLVRVFLLDYGELSEPVNRGSCIRSLPQRFKVLPPPMAIQVVLPGLRPLSLDIDHAMGMGTMSQVFADSWSSAAVDTVRTLISQTNHRWAILTNWQKDRAGRYLADVQLRGHPFKIHLHRILIDSGFAFFDQQRYQEQLQANRDISLDRMMSNLSICGPGTGIGNTSVNDSSYCFEEETDEDLDETKGTECEVPSAKLFNWDVIPPITRKKKVETQPKLEEKVNGKLLERIRNTKMGKAKIKPTMMSVWDQFKNSSDETNKKNRNYLVIPAGMDPGKFLEEQLARITDHDGIGPKMLDPKLVCVKDMK